eukprot:1158677-Pelagomonas_calceolata.AAC.7
MAVSLPQPDNHDARTPGPLVQGHHATSAKHSTLICAPWPCQPLFLAARPDTNGLAARLQTEQQWKQIPGATHLCTAAMLAIC